LLGSLSKDELATLSAALTDGEAAALHYEWPAWARKEQLAPALSYDGWLILAGRGWGNPADDAAAKVAILKANTESIIAQLGAQNRAANAEAASADPWTSRARPSFLYVMYALILASVPMGFLAAIRPDMAKDVAAGMQAWLAAIPIELWQVFGLCFSVYGVSRTVEKVKGVAK
jgi:hypothetical protein